MFFSLTAKQTEANKLLASQAKYIFLYGGSRSGKTFLWVRAICIRALKSAGSRHAALRFRNNAIKQSIVMDTFPKVMKLCFPEVAYKTNMSDLYATFENGSEIWFGGLDDKERVEKILGNEYATIGFNEVSQIPYTSYLMALTRLAQKCHQTFKGVVQELPLKCYLDANPPPKSHWSYKVFIQKMNPDTRQVLPDQEEYASMLLNPKDNQDNLPADYVRTLEAMPEHMRRRFLLGQFGDDNPNAIFSEIAIDKWRQTGKQGEQMLPDFVRIIVGVDPSGASGEEDESNDAIGIVIGALGTDGNAYMLEDLTVKAGPAVWGKVATDAYERHQADVIVAEVNYGGDMVRFVIKTADPRANFKKITASRGKVVRAEPIAALVEQGKIRFVGYHPELEEELAGFSKNGYIGEKSPNRADAFVWVMAELFPGVVTPRKERKKDITVNRGYTNQATSWMN